MGLLLSAGWVGSLLTLLPCGLAADRLGERAVLTVGLSVSALCLAAAAYATEFAVLLLLLALAGALALRPLAVQESARGA